MVGVGAGDVNGDGFDDLIVGARGNDTGGIHAGAAYVVFGTANGLTAVDLDDIANGTGGFKIIGETHQDRSSRSVSAAGDVDGDGFDDLIVGAYRNNAAGAAYVVYGADFTDQVDFLGVDDVSLESITGTGSDEILIGGRGDDTIDGGAGNDVIIGGAGDDTITFDAADTLKVDAGSGTDILSIAGSGVAVDLTAIGDGVYEGFERIDLTGGGNTLTLAVSDIYAITEGRNALTGTANTLIVDGNAGDVVNAGSAGRWSMTPSISATAYTPSTPRTPPPCWSTTPSTSRRSAASLRHCHMDQHNGDGDWDNGGNWSPAQAPTDGDEAALPDFIGSINLFNGDHQPGNSQRR